VNHAEASALVSFPPGGCKRPWQSNQPCITELNPQRRRAVTRTSAASSKGSQRLPAVSRPKGPLELSHDPSGAYARFLDARPVRFLGRISFSFYLLHFVALYICAEIAVLAGLPGTFGLPLNVAVTLASIALAAAGAAISYRLVERPSIAAGRQTAAIFAPPGTPRAINSAS
jgi:hypothetical protein